MRIWRLQNRASMETGPSWFAYGSVEVDCPAHKDGWRGFWWAYQVDGMGHVWYDSPVLVRRNDIPRAKRGEEVDVFVPGLMGCQQCCSLWSYLHHNCGFRNALPKRNEQFVIEYEGDIYPEYYVADEGADVFRPVKVRRIMDAAEFYEQCGNGIICGEEE